MLKKIIALIFCVLAMTTSAAVPQLLSYQGHAENANGPMVGNYDVTFSLYSTSTGGTALWTEGPLTLNFIEGVYQATLGKTQNLSALSFDQAMYLEIEIDGQVMEERVELTSVPYAMFADVAEGAERADYAETLSEDFVVSNLKLKSGVLPECNATNKGMLRYSGKSTSSISGTGIVVVCIESSAMGNYTYQWNELTMEPVP